MDIDLNQNSEKLKMQLNKLENKILATKSAMHKIMESDSYKKWSKDYNNTIKNIESVKSKKDVDMSEYSKLNKTKHELLHSPDITKFLKLKSSLKEMQNERTALQKNLKELSNSKNPNAQEPVTNNIQDKASISQTIAALRKLNELQALNRKMEFAQNRKKIVDSIMSMSEKVNNSLTSAATKYRDTNNSINNIRGIYESKVNVISQYFGNLMQGYESIISLQQAKYNETMAKIASKEVDIEFYKKRVSSKYYDKKGFLQWESKTKKLDAEMQKLKSSKEMTPEQIKRYNECAKQKAALYSDDRFKNNPLVQMYKQKEDLTKKANALELNIQNIEAEEKTVLASYTKELENALKEKNTSLAKIEKQNVFQKLFGAITNRFNSQKKLNNFVISPIEQLTKKLDNISQNLQSQADAIYNEITGDSLGDKSKSRGSILTIINKGKEYGDAVISKLTQRIEKSSEQIKTKVKSAPAPVSVKTAGPELA